MLTSPISEDQASGRISSISGYEKWPKESQFEKGINLDKVSNNCVGLQPLGIFAVKNVPGYGQVRTSKSKEILLDIEKETCDTEGVKLNSEKMYKDFGRYCNQSGYNEVPGGAVRGSDWYAVSNVSAKESKESTRLSAANMNLMCSSFIGGYRDVPADLGDNLTPDIQDAQLSRDKLITKQTEYNGQTLIDPSGRYPLK